MLLLGKYHRTHLLTKVGCINQSLSIASWDNQETWEVWDYCYQNLGNNFTINAFKEEKCTEKYF